jgi:hypothetical protein
LIFFIDNSSTLMVWYLKVSSWKYVSLYWGGALL